MILIFSARAMSEPDGLKPHRPVADFKWSVADCIRPVQDYIRSITDFKWPVADCIRSVTDVHRSVTDCIRPIADYMQ